MQFGVHLPHLGRNVGRESLTQFAQAIEEAGFASGWVSDHVCWPADIQSDYPYTDDGSFAPASDMGAKQLATLDVLSNGRLILGAGVGWMREEAEILGMPWDHRGARSDEQLELFQQLFTQERPTYSGEYYQLPEVGFEPKPVQTPVPIWIGGSSPAAFRRAGRFGSGFHAAFQSRSEVAEEWQQVKQQAELAGRDPSQLVLSLRVYLDPAGAMEAEKSLSGSKQQMQDTVGELAEIGVQHLVLDPVARGGVSGRLDAVLNFAAEIMAEASSPK